MSAARSGVFADLEVQIDPWEPGYGEEFALDAGSDEPEPEVTLDLELPAGEWRPIEPAPGAGPPRLVFVDGVRRLEARFIVRRGEKMCRGAFGSFAVGAVAVEQGVANVERARAERLAVVGSGEKLPSPVPVMPALTYEPATTASAEADGPLRHLQEQMRAAEERLARELADDAQALVLTDGPLTFQDPVRGAAVGYIKRIFKLYLPAPLGLGLLARLSAGARTPVFALRGPQRFGRYSWFMRLAPPGAGDSELGGLARLEVSESVGIEAARRLADATAACLVAFTPGRSRDPRSPQNLLPIGALESYLRRRLGDARLIRRNLESLIARESRPR
jgi:hypothetical protein